MAARVRAVVPGELDELDLVRNRDRPREVGEKDDARFEQRDEQQLALGVVVRDLRAELLDASTKLLRREEDLSDAVVGDYDATSSR